MNLLKATLLLISSLTVMAGATVAPALPMMRDFFSDYPNADLLTRLVITMPALFIALFSPVAGWLLDTYSKKKLLLITILIYALAGASGLLLNNLYHILISRAVLGIAVSIIMTGATALVGDYLEGKERMEFLGMQGAFMAFGGTIFVSIAGYLAGMSWRYPFGVYLAALLIFGLSAKVLYEPKKEAVDQNMAGGEKQSEKNIRPLQYLIYSTIFLGMVLFYIIPVQSPFLLEELGAKKGLMTSMGLIVGTFCAAVASFFYNHIKRRLHFHQIYAILFFMFGAGFICIGFTESIGQVIVYTAFACAGIGLLMPNTSLYLLSLSQAHNRGRIMGGMTGAVFLGQFCSPIALQPIVNQVGLLEAHIYAGGFSVLLGLLYLFYYLQKR